MTPSQLGPEIERLYHLCYELKQAIQREYGFSDNDERIKVFNKIENVLKVPNVNMYFLDKFLTKSQWWDENEQLGVDNSARVKFCQEYEMSIRINLIQNFNYAIESSLRIFSRNIQPGACNDGLDSFMSIYQSILKQAGLKEKYESTYNLLRLVRNTMHNNGLFMPKNGGDQVVIVGKTHFEFKVGKHCEFVNTNFVLKLISTVVTTLPELYASDIFKRVDKMES